MTDIDVHGISRSISDVTDGAMGSANRSEDGVMIGRCSRGSPFKKERPGCEKLDLRNRLQRARPRRAHVAEDHEPSVAAGPSSARTRLAGCRGQRGVGRPGRCSDSGVGAAPVRAAGASGASGGAVSAARTTAAAVSTTTTATAAAGRAATSAARTGVATGAATRAAAAGAARCAAAASRVGAA